jgi:hypothetical protein
MKEIVNLALQPADAQGFSGRMQAGHGGCIRAEVGGGW